LPSSSDIWQNFESMSEHGDHSKVLRFYYEHYCEAKKRNGLDASLYAALIVSNADGITDVSDQNKQVEIIQELLSPVLINKQSRETYVELLNDSKDCTKPIASRLNETEKLPVKPATKSTRPAPSLQDLISTLLFWLSMACYGIGQFSIAFIGLGIGFILLAPPIAFLFWALQGFPSGFWHWNEYLEMIVWPTLGVIGIWAGVSALGLLIFNIGKRVSPDLDIWERSVRLK
jgi:hypothetical protein